MPGDDKQWLLEQFRDIASERFDNNKREELAGKLYERYDEQRYDDAVEFLRDLEDGTTLDFSSLVTYLKNISNEDLIEEQEDQSASDAIDEGDKRALMARMSDVDNKKVVGKVQAPANQRSLNLLSEQIYKRHNKLAFFISPSTTISGDVRQQMRKTKESIDLLKVCEASDDDDKMYEFVHFGDSVGKKKVLDKLTGDFYMYQFIAEDKEYIVFSQEEIDTGRVDITGTVFSLNDVTRVGDNRKITKSTDVIFAHSNEPAIEPLDDHELEELKERATHDWFAEHLLGEWRHPELFEKLLIADMLVKDENGWPSPIILFGPTTTGKSKIMQSFMTSMDEHQEMMKGEQSTIKGLVPSFSQEPPDPGYLAKCHRVACVDEFFNLLDDNNDNSDVFRKLLTLLEHDPSNATSGNGSITVEPDATMIASTNPTNGVDDFVQMADELDDAFMSRCLLYNFSKTHVDFVEARKPEIKKKKSRGGEDALFPEREDLFVSFVDTMREETSLMDQVDFVKVAEIKKELQHMVPNRLSEVYRGRYDHHMENILIGMAKYNSMIEERDEICVMEQDYEDMKAIFEFVLQSWKRNPEGDISSLSPEAKKAYISEDKAKLYNLVETHNKMTMDEILGYTDDEYAEAKAESLIDMEMLKRVKLADGEYIVPHWYSHGDEV